MDPGVHVRGFRILHPPIPDSISGWILDFRIPDSGFRIPKPWLPVAKITRIPDYFAKGESRLCMLLVGDPVFTCN